MKEVEDARPEHENSKLQGNKSIHNKMKMRHLFKYVTHKICKNLFVLKKILTYSVVSELSML